MSCENPATSVTSISSHSQTLLYQQSRGICVGGGQPGARGSLHSQRVDSLGALESGRLTTLSLCDRSPLLMIGLWGWDTWGPPLRVAAAHWSSVSLSAVTPEVTR